jgi:hypothetical protein
MLLIRTGRFTRKLIAALLGVLWLGSASAQAPSTWYTSLTINYVYAGQAGGRVAVAVNEPINFGPCPRGAPAVEFVLDMNNPFFKQMLMMIMTAYVTGRPINLFTNGQCYATGLLLMDVWLPM